MNATNIEEGLDPPLPKQTPVKFMVSTPFNSLYEELSPSQVREEVLSTIVYMRNSGSYRTINANLGVFTKVDVVEEEQRYLLDNLTAKKQHLL